ncbi:hypothetical protein L218DRAFT_373991 [Marasmius fiardii PR-910]|nr:hypothetical protein L218DRAFT_373991 [Marasmius fiardii PR-910]
MLHSRQRQLQVLFLPAPMNHSTKFRYPEPDMEVEETDYQPSDSTENSRAVAPLLSSKLKARFAKIHDERGSLSERRFWLKNNLHTKCSSCEERGLKCSPHPENIRCEACNRRKNGCSRVADERRDRTMRILRIDRRTYEALSTWYDKNKNWYKGEQVGQSKTASLDDKPINLPSVKKPRFSETTQRPQLKTPTQPVFRGAYMHATSCGSKTTSNAGVRAPIASNSNSGSRSLWQEAQYQCLKHLMLVKPKLHQCQAHRRLYDL